MEDKKPNNPIAFPCETTTYTDMGVIDVKTTTKHSGMSLRDYFAAKAMQSVISNSDTMREITKAWELTHKDNKKGREFEDCISKLAFYYADSMLKQREL